MIGISCIATGVNVRAVRVIGNFHLTRGPQIPRALEIFPAPNSIPIARRVHSLSSVVSSWPQVLGPEKLFAGLVDEHRVVCNGPAIVVQIVRALCIRIVGPTLSCQITLVINNEMILVEMIVLTEIWTRVELDPGRIRTKPVAHNQVTNATKKITARYLRACAVGRIPWGNVWVVPEKLCYRHAPLWLRGPATLAQKPCGVRIFEAIDGVTKTDIVFPLQVWKLIIVVTRGRAVRQDFVEIRIGVMLKERVSQRRIAVRRCPQ